MNKKFATALLASAFIPFAAQAQGTSTPPATTTPPAATDTTTPGASTTTPPAGGAAAPAAGTAGTPMDAEDDAMDTDDADVDAAAPASGTSSTDTAMSSDSEMDGPFVTVEPTGAWRVSDLEGKDVEDANGENIGQISDTLVNEEGEVIAVLVGVGGFLGIGAKDVAVSMTALEFGPGSMEGLSTAPAADTAAAPAAPAAGGTTGAAAPASGDAAATAEEPPVVGEDNLPDRIVLNVTREELEAAPAYGEPEDAASDTGAMGTGGATGGMAPAGGTTGGMAPAGGTAPATGSAPAQ